MTDLEAQKFSAIVKNARGVMTKLDESAPQARPAQSNNTHTFENERTFDSNVRLIKNDMMNNSQPDLDYSDVYSGHVDMQGNKIDLSFDIPQNMYSNSINEDIQLSSNRLEPVSDVNITPDMVENAKKNSALGSIIDSFATNPINVRSDEYDDARNVSVLDRLGITPQKQQKTVSVESKQSPMQEQINYDTIRSVIKTEIKACMDEIKKSLVTESKTHNPDKEIGYITVGKKGNQIKVITADGKIYEVSLKYIGDVDKK